MAISIPPRRESALDKVAKAVGIARDILGTGASVYGAYQQKKEADLAEELQPLKKQEAELSIKSKEKELGAVASDIIPGKAKLMEKYEVSEVPSAGFVPVKIQEVGDDNKTVIKTVYAKPLPEKVTSATQQAIRSFDYTKNKDLNKFAQDVAQEYTKLNVPEFAEKLKNIESLIPGGLDGYDPETDLPGVGATGALPKAALSQSGKDLRTAVAGLRNAIQKMQAGTSLTEGEKQALLEELNTGVTASDLDLVTALKNTKKVLNAKIENIGAGVPPEALEVYKSRPGAVKSPADMSRDEKIKKLLGK